MNEFSWSEHIQFGVSLFALIAPFSIAPIFLGLTGHLNQRSRVLAATVATGTMFVVLCVSFLFGEQMISTLGTSIESFQIGGGLIIVFAGFSMMSNPHIPSEDDVESEKGASALHIGVAPVGIPLLGGPGAMTKVMLEGHDNWAVTHQGAVVSILLACTVATWLVLAGAGSVIRFLGASGIQVLQRLSGLIVIAIGIEVVVSGVLGHATRFIAGL